MKRKHLTIHKPGHRHWKHALHNSEYTLVARCVIQTKCKIVSLALLYQAHLVTCVPFVVFWKLCVCCVWQLWAQELLFQCELVSLQPAWRKHQLWCPSPNPALLLSSSFSASPSPFASHVLELLLQVWARADAEGVRRKKKTLLVLSY